MVYAVKVGMVCADIQPDSVGPHEAMTPSGQLQEEHLSQEQHSPSQHTTLTTSSKAKADFPEAPLSVTALLARMQKLKSAK